MAFDRQHKLQLVRSWGSTLGSRGPALLDLLELQVTHPSLLLLPCFPCSPLQLLEPLSYKVDLEQLAKRTQAVQWRWEAVSPFFEGLQAGRAYGLLAGRCVGVSGGFV